MVARFGHEMLLLAGLLALVFWLASMLSYSPQDPAWSTSGAGHARLVANWMGRVGAWLADACYFGFGMSVWWLVLASLQTWLSSFARWLRGGVPRDGVPLPPLWRRRLRFWGGLLLLLGASCALEWTRLYRFESVLPGPAGGVFGYMLGYHSLQWLGFMGSGLIGICVAVIGLAMVFRFSWGHLAESMGARLDGWVLFLFARREKARDEAAGRRAAREREEVVQEERTESAVQHPQPVQIIEPVLQEAAIPSVRVVKERQKPLFSELPDSKLPQVDLLDAAQQRQESVSPETLEMTSRLIEKRLKDFGVDVHVVAAMPGPVITRYEIEPATGVKGSQIVNLAKDLARSLSLVSIRVIETIPGKNFMALELPNAKRQSIRLSEVLGSQVYHDAKSMLTMGLGKDIVGNPVVADLAKMPHVLVAGTTGSGKSVGINAMILSLLYKAEARDVRLLMIDPKMLEMSVYEGIPHLLCPVVTDMKQAANGLNWCVAEMERRYKLMSKLGVRNLAGYNTKIDEAKAREESIPNPFSLTPEEPEPLQRLPHIVIVIDELADLMMVVGKKIEELIARLAQKARAAGIHLILATQRPSVDVITGLIKANIPTRIAFQVSSKIDSRTVLDQMGAESLLGMGDMLYMASGTGLPVRVHGAFVSDEEVHRVVGYLKEQGEADYIEGVLEGGTAEGDSEFGSESGDGGNGEKDPMYDQAVEVVLKDRKASISYVQRKLRIGYNRSARLLEDMEKAGLVSGLTASGQREVLVPARAGE
ncbi:cell division protein FtsK/SpoIIIE [Delftia sp. Cs1-4]|nr:cell division protein FtsK/SpoIIIE [Delftia sp. Cs1-4]EZP48366.1 S-DNA-T family DNA segregation ATPase FtsK/SpoIIIE [Delftia sp. RIT313]ROR03978.1 DNA translocase FtsK [Delftia acidovorans]SOE34580.1 DNA translocase FtsK [Delftia acidovorans]